MIGQKLTGAEVAAMLGLGKDAVSIIYANFAAYGGVMLPGFKRPVFYKNLVDKAIMEKARHADKTNKERKDDMGRANNPTGRPKDGTPFSNQTRGCRVGGLSKNEISGLKHDPHGIFNFGDTV